MFKHNIKYTDFNGLERQEDLYFHLTLPELTRLEAELGTSIEQYSKDIAESQDVPKLLAFLEKMVLSSYGKKTTDGKSFMKNKELREEFEYSQAYAELFEQLITNPELARKFGEKVADDGKKRTAPTMTSNLAK